MPDRVTYSLSLKQSSYVSESGTFDIKRYAQTVQYAEQLGFAHVLIPDHVFIPEYWARVVGGRYLEPFVALSYLAALTTRIRLVTGCLVVPYRQPFITAKSVATLDHLSGGRFELGVVPGYLKEEFETFNLSLEERGAITDEFLEIMTALWSQETVTYGGKFYSCTDVSIWPRCGQPHLPIWVGGSSRFSIRRAVRFGSVWNPLGYDPAALGDGPSSGERLSDKTLPSGNTTPAGLVAGLAYARELAESKGRDLGELRAVVNPGSPVVGHFWTADRLAPYVEAGASGLVFSPPDGEQAEILASLDRYRAEVMDVL